PDGALESRVCSDITLASHHCSTKGRLWANEFPARRRSAIPPAGKHCRAARHAAPQRVSPPTEAGRKDEAISPSLQGTRSTMSSGRTLRCIASDSRPRELPSERLEPRTHPSLHSPLSPHSPPS